MMRVEYRIFKRLYGLKFPGELWHECGSITKARRIFNRKYKDEPGATGDEKNVFHIIKVTYEDVK